MTAVIRLLAVLGTALLLIAAPAQAQVLSVETWVEEWDPQAQRWVRVEEGAERRVAAADRPAAQALAVYGPFRVVEPTRAEMVGVSDSRSPGEFRAMLRDFPSLATLTMVECPGTDNDIGNLELGRLIRAAGLETHVPSGGSVRSGAVELFLAGTTRRIDDGAEFAVHSWRDNYGREARDFGADEGANATYLAYYREMGMDAAQAGAFYAMTNSVPHANARWLTAQEMRGWLGEAAAPAVPVAPRLAFADTPFPGTPHSGTGRLDSASVLP